MLFGLLLDPGLSMLFITNSLMQSSECSKLVFSSLRSYSSFGGSSYQATSANSAILDKLWTRVRIEPLSKEDLIHVSSMNI